MQATLKRLPRRRAGFQGAGGFTLIELLIVIVIMGILAAIVVFGVQNITASSAQTACASDFKTTESAVEIYKDQTGSYPNATVAHGGNSALPATDSDASSVNAAVSAAGAGGELLVQGNVAPNTGTSAIGPWLKSAPTNTGHYTIFIANDGSGKITIKNGSGAPVAGCSAIG